MKYIITVREISKTCRIFVENPTRHQIVDALIAQYSYQLHQYFADEIYAGNFTILPA